MGRTNDAKTIHLLRILTWVLLVLAACNPPTPLPPLPPCNCDLTITNIEVTQGTQTPTNTIQLVAQRSTAVRATIAVSGGSPPIRFVTGRLHVFVGGTEITPASGIEPLGGSFDAPTSPHRANQNDTLNFELLAPTGITASPNVTFRVDIMPRSGETNTGNNTLTTGNLSFVDRRTPSLFYTSVLYTPSGLSYPNQNLIAPGSGDLFVRGILPVNDGDPNLYRRGLFPKLTFTEDANGNGRLDGSDRDKLLDWLADERMMLVIFGKGASDNTFLYGWLRDNPIDGNGLSQISGNNAFGNTDVTRGQRSYAHELTHNFGLYHNNDYLNEVGWDVGAHLITGSWAGANGVTERIKPTTLFDIQWAGRLTNEAWVDTATYNFLLGSTILAQNQLDEQRRTNLQLIPSEQQVEPIERVAVVHGIFDPSGEKLIQLNPVFRFPWASQPSIRRSGPFVVEITDDAGTVTKTPFNALVADDPDKRPEQEVYGFFEVMVSVAPSREMAALRITDATGQREFGAFKRSTPPQIRIVAPRQGAQLGDRTEVTWEVSDPDTMLDQLLLHVAYSPNGGRNWVPIAVNVRGTEKGITFDSTEIQQSRESGVIRVFVSDGLNTAFADVGSLTATAAQFPPP